MDIWEKLFGKIGMWVIPLLIVAWLAQQIVPHVLDIAGDKVKGDLSLTREQQARVAESRNRDIPLLYNKLLEAEDDVGDLYYLHKPVGVAPRVVDPAAVLQTVRELRDLVNRTSIYFPTTLSSMLDQFSSDLSSVARALETREILLQSGVSGSDDRIVEIDHDVVPSIGTHVPELKAAIEREFKKLLGTD